MANWIESEQVKFKEKHSPIFTIAALDDGTYDLELEGGWDHSSSVNMTKEELQMVITAMQKVIR